MDREDIWDLVEEITQILAITTIIIITMLWLITIAGYVMIMETPIYGYLGLSIIPLLIMLLIIFLAKDQILPVELFYTLRGWKKRRNKCMNCKYYAIKKEKITEGGYIIRRKCKKKLIETENKKFNKNMKCKKFSPINNLYSARTRTGFHEEPY